MRESRIYKRDDLEMRRNCAHTGGGGECSILTSILLQVFIYLQLFVRSFFSLFMADHDMPSSFSPYEYSIVRYDV